jgi:hypothetical protein
MFCHPWVNAFCNPMPTCNLLTMAIHKLHARFIGKYLIPYSCKMFNNCVQFSLFESTLQLKVRKQIILVWLQKDLPTFATESSCSSTCAVGD